MRRRRRVKGFAFGRYSVKKDKYTVLFPDGDRQKIRIPDPDVKVCEPHPLVLL